MAKPETMHEGKFLKLVKKDNWEYVERCGIEGVVALLTETDDEQFVFIEQFRLPIGKSIIEIPAGLFGDGDEGETLEQAALRELQEETGYTSDEVEQITVGPSSAGLTSELVTYYIARNSRKISEGGGVGNEEIKIHLVPVHEAHDWLGDQAEAGKIIDSKVYTALYFWLHSVIMDEEDDEG